jgi:methyl-accepting chemotaxis protein
MRKKINLLNVSGLLILGLLSMSVAIYYWEQNKRNEVAYIRTLMLEERKAQLNDLISNAYSVVKSANFWTDGQRALNNMRFGSDGKNYYFVMDREGVFFVHPDRQNLVGKKQLDLEDADGKKIIREIIKIANEEGEGLIEYRWPKPGTDQPVRKLTHIKLFKDWNWILCTGIYIDDIEKAITLKESELTSSMVIYLTCQAVIIVAILICVMLVSIWLSRRISSSVDGSVKKIHDIAWQVASASDQVLVSSRNVANNADEEAEMIRQTIDSLDKIFSSARRNIENTDAINGLLLKTHQVLGQTDQSMNALDKSMMDISQSSANVSQVIELINNLAFKIKFVALNASVEAARLGARGNSFAVIADEIRRMADHSAEAARNTGKLIEDSLEKSHRGVQQVTVSRKMFSKVMSSVEEVNGLVRHITASSDQQNREIEHIQGANLVLKKATGNNTDLAAESASTAREMSEYAEQMNRVVADLVHVVGYESTGRDGKPIDPGTIGAVQPRVDRYRMLPLQTGTPSCAVPGR